MIKIADFGLSEDVLEKNYFRQGGGSGERVKLPVKWMAPESLSDGHFSEKSDVVCWLKPTATSCNCLFAKFPMSTIESGCIWRHALLSLRQPIVLYKDFFYKRYHRFRHAWPLLYTKKIEFLLRLFPTVVVWSDNVGDIQWREGPISRN